jgi:hypothetical protein
MYHDGRKSVLQTPNTKGEEAVSFEVGKSISISAVGSYLIVLLDKNSTSIGSVVSAGPECKLKEVNDRVVIPTHKGYLLQFKGNIKVRVLKEADCLSPTTLTIN